MKWTPGLRKRLLDRDERIRLAALYDLSQGGTRYVSQVAVWKHAAYLKKELQLGEWGPDSPQVDPVTGEMEHPSIRAIDRLELAVLCRHGARAPLESDSQA